MAGETVTAVTDHRDDRHNESPIEKTQPWSGKDVMSGLAARSYRANVYDKSGAKRWACVLD